MMYDKFLHSLDDVREEQEALLERQQDPDFALASDYAVGALSEDEAREVRARIERDPEFRDLVDPLLALAERGPAFVPPARHEIEKRWGELRDQIRRTSADPQMIASLARARESRTRRRIFVWSLAAVLLPFVIFPAIPVIADLFRDARHYVPPGSTEIVDLGGGSTATLSSGTNMIKSPAPSDTALYFFSGDGEFHIAPGRTTPFILQMRGARVVVTGTRFHAHGYDHEPATVTVTEGAVQFWGIDDSGVPFGEPLVVKAGERARAYRTKLPERLP